MAGGKPNYKELTLQQLRSLCETARRGSFVAAAAALDISQPTVWKQVHALEREFGVKLVEPHGRGCHLTAAGRRLVDMVGPAVEAVAGVRERLRAALADADGELTVAVTPRMLLEDLAPCVGRFHARFPATRFTFLELADEAVAAAVLARQADFGFTPTPLAPDQQGLLAADPVYSLEARLIAPKDHPLARRRAVRPRDLTRYPLVNGPAGFSSDYIRAVLEKSAAAPRPRHVVRSEFASSIRRFVKMGFGIGLVPAVPSAPLHRDLHERSMGRYYGGIGVQVVRRRGAYTPAAGEDFIRLVRADLAADAPAGG